MYLYFLLFVALIPHVYQGYKEAITVTVHHSTATIFGGINNGGSSVAL